MQLLTNDGLACRKRATRIWTRTYSPLKSRNFLMVLSFGRAPSNGDQCTYLKWHTSITMPEITGAQLDIPYHENFDTV